MARHQTSYSAARQRTALPTESVSLDPVTGFYRIRLRSGGVYVGVRIWYGAPLDPVTGEELDRGWRWQALANERPIDLDRVWPQCGGSPIDESEYRHLTALQNWGERNAPGTAVADPRKRIDLLTAPLPF